MALKKKPNSLNINFNFSDDSDDDEDNNVQPKHILKDEQNRSGNLAKYLQLAVDKTIVAGDHLNRCELASFSEDLGPPIKESTLLYGSAADSTLYVTALGDHCFASNYVNTSKVSKLHTSKKGERHNRDENLETNKENVCLITDLAKMRSPISDLSHKSSSINHNLDINGIQTTPLKGNKLSTKHRLFGCNTPLSKKSVEYNGTRLSSVPILPVKLSVLGSQLESSFIDSVGEKTSHKHHELINESFVEVQDVSLQTSFYVDVQDVSLQTSFIVEGLHESKQVRDYEFKSTDSNCVDVIDYSPALKSPQHSYSSRDSDKSINLNVSCIHTDDTPNDAQVVELSCYEVQDISVQTSFVEEAFLMDTAYNVSSLQEIGKEQNVKILEKSVVKLPLQTNNKDNDNVKITMDNKIGASVCSNNNVAGSSAVELYATAYQEICEKINVCAITASLGNGEVNKGNFETAQSCKLRTVDTKIHEHQMNTSDNPQFKSDLLEQSCQTYPVGEVNFTSKERKVFSNNFVENINSGKDFSSNGDDVDNRCEILVAASDCEDEGNQDNLNEYDVDKIEESSLSDLDTDDNDTRESTVKSDSETENTEAVAGCSECNTINIGCRCVERSIDKNCTSDHTVTLQETSSYNDKSCSDEGGIGAKNFKTGQNSVNFNSIQQRRDLVSSDDDSDFENFLGKMKSSLKPQKPSREEIPPLCEFIVDDDEDFSGTEGEDCDDELFCIKTTSELNELSGKRYPPRYTETVHTHHHTDASDYETSDSDLDDFIVDKPPKKTSGKAKSELNLSSDNFSSDDDLLPEKDSLGKRKIRIAPELQVTKDDSCDDVVKLKPGSNFPKTPGKNVNFSPKQTSRTPCGGTNDLPSRRLEETLFKTPGNLEQWKRPFETPARRHVNKEDFKTPLNMRGSSLQPTTAPRSFYGSTGLKDDSSFLKSLTADIPDYMRHADAARFVKFFKANKAELVQKLFKIFNSAIFEDKLPKDLEFEWSVRYRSTAGTFYYKRTADNIVSKVTLSVKVCDSPERVRDTLAHELCHAAVRLINGISESHGPVWISWARKISRAFPFMPVIARCHGYHISTKYTYQCVKCKYRIGRHSKSLDTERKVCGHCCGKFELYLTSELNSSNESCKTPVTSRTPRTPNKFALFVKECYSTVKKREDGLRHGDIMKILSQEFAEKNKICE